MFNCLNKENKKFTNYLSVFVFLLIFSCFLFILSYIHIYIYIYIYIYMPSFDVESAYNYDTCPYFLIQMYENVCLDSLLVKLRFKMIL
jgi:hypothetical protein